MFKKLHISLIFNNLLVFKSLTANITLEVPYRLNRKNRRQPSLMAAKVAAFTMMQYFNFLNHKPIGQVKYALF